jgi:metallo-beta-lactamase family protein
VPVHADVVELRGLSVHADAGEMVRWLSHCPSAPRTTYVVHGEPESAHALAERVATELGWVTVVPRYGERVRLD